MRTLKLTIEYDGTAYVGWQIQPNGLSVQGLVQHALCTMTQENIKLVGASRTDAGVHALAQIASFRTLSRIACENFLRGLPSLLPHDIVVHKVEEMPIGYNAMKHARKKHYRYLILNDRVPSALLRKRAWHVRSPLNLSALRRASRCLIGEHDFSSFMGQRTSVRSPVRRIERITIKKQRAGTPGQLLEITIVGNGFLRNQVRNIVGTLVEIGEGKRSPDEMSTILHRRKRTAAGMCAPACGLYLVKVY